MYDFLFGGFDTLANCEDDDGECDELDSVPAHLKTKDGYLKDGFVVDTSGEDDEEDDEEDEDEDDDENDDEDEDEDEDEDGDDGDEEDGDEETATVVAINAKKPKPLSKRRDKKPTREEVLVDTSSELSEEAYEYCDD
jgi:hypothetical protein